MKRLALACMVLGTVSTTSASIPLPGAPTARGPFYRGWTSSRHRGLAHSYLRCQSGWGGGGVE